MTTPRDVLARAIHRHTYGPDDEKHWETATRDYYYAEAEEYVTALADAGLLLPDGTQTRTEHGYRYRNSPDHDWTRIDIVSEDEAIAMVGDALATIPNAEAEHLTRRVHTEPWQPSEAEWQPGDPIYPNERTPMVDPESRYCTECGCELGPHTKVVTCTDCQRPFCGYPRSLPCLGAHRELGTCPDYADGVLTDATPAPTTPGDQT